MPREYATGADESPYDVRTFAYAPSGVPKKGGTKYTPKDIEDQHKVGICTGISLTQNAKKALGIDFSDDFQYLCQKKFKDGNWDEGSSASSALWVGKNIGLLPAEHWTFTTEAERKLPYDKYIKKLQAVPDKEIERLKTLAAPYKLRAYAKVPVDWATLAEAVNESEAGILARFVLGKEWWTNPIEPLRPPKKVISGHLTIISNYDGGSFRIANTWGSDWADNGTAYFLLGDYAPTEAWIPYYNEVPKHIQKQLDSREQIYGKLLDAIQKLLVLLKK